MADLLTAEQLRAILPRADADTWTAPIAQAFARWGITSAPARAAALAVWGEESGQMTGGRERLNYSAQRLAQVWPGRFSATGHVDGPPNDTAVTLAAAGEQAIANVVYANTLGNGGPETGDGWAFRGGCLTQITFFANWNACALAHGQPLSRVGLGIWADQAQRVPALNASCSAWFFAVYAKLLPLANTGNETDFLAAAHRVGAPPPGPALSTWLTLWKRALAVLGGGIETTTIPARLDAARVVRVQMALNQAGAFPLLDPDGTWGPRTEAAADRYRHDHGLPPADGPSDDLARALGVA